MFGPRFVSQDGGDLGTGMGLPKTHNAVPQVLRQKTQRCCGE